MNKFKKFLLKKDEIFSSLIALIIAFVIVAIIMFSTGRAPGEALYYFIKGAFGNVSNTSNTISRVIPLTIAGIAFLIGAKCAVFNVGVEGQLILGALASAIVGYIVDLPKIIHLPLMLLAGAVAGGLYAFIPAWLKTKRKVNEILSTIMLNYPATYFTHFMVLKVLPMEGIVPATPFIADSARFRTLIEGTRLHGGFIVAILVVVFAYFFLQKTSIGYEMRAVGLNKEAAKFHGIPVDRRMIEAFVISGALAGLAGAVEVAGVHYRFLDQFSPGYGYDSITVAMVGLMNPIGIVFSAILFGALKTGILDMSVYTEIPRQLTTLINGIVVLLIASKEMIRGGFAKVVRGKTDYGSDKE